MQLECHLSWKQVRDHILTLMAGFGLLFFSLPLAQAQTDRKPGHLSPSYYKKDWGVLDCAFLQSTLEKKALSKQDIDALCLVLENSDAEHFRQIEKNINNYARDKPEGDELLLLTQLREDLVSERAQIIESLFKRFPISSLKGGWEDVFRSLLTTSVDSEIAILLLSVPQALGNPNSIGVALQIVERASNHGLLADKKDISLVNEIEDALMSISNEPLSPRRFRARELLVKMGTSKGDEIVKEAVTMASDRKTTLTELDSLVPPAIIFLTLSPKAFTRKDLKCIGDNVKRFDHQKFRQSFFNNVNLMLRHYKKVQNTVIVNDIGAFLQTEADYSDDKEWARMARECLDQS